MIIPGFVGGIAAAAAVGLISQVVVRDGEIQAIKAAEDLAVVEAGAPHIEEDLVFVDGGNVQHRNRRGA